MSVTIKNSISKSINGMLQKIDKLPREAYQEFVKDTPIRSGNARRKTKLSGNKIIAGYNYAQKLDEGFSRQAPDGMTKPTEEFIKKRMTQIIKGK
jgi:hypothetical protein